MSYSGYIGDLSKNPDIGEQVAAGQDPSTIEGLEDRSGATRKSIASTEAEEKRLARESYKSGVTYEQDSADLPSR